MEKLFYYHPLATICYYKFGKGKKNMLCFHGLGMHGRQFYVFNKEMGAEYTFYGLDLFFHEGTKLNNNTLTEVKRGIEPVELTQLINDFCIHLQINKFSLLSYSLGTFYASCLSISLKDKIEECFFLAPIFLEVKRYIRILSANKIGNYIFEKIMLSENGMLRLVQLLKSLKVIDSKVKEILVKEIATPELRFNMYANFTYLRKLYYPKEEYISKSNDLNIPTYYIFGKKDYNVNPNLAYEISDRIKKAKSIIINQDHDLVNSQFTLEMLFCKKL